MPSPDLTLSRPTTAIDLCGELSIRIRGRLLESLPGRQGRALFGYLVLNRYRPVSRDELIDVLWPSSPPAAPDAAFASVLARVRQAVGRDVIHGRAELRLRLEPDAEIDVETVREQTLTAEQALRDGDLQAAWDTAEAARRIAGRPLLAGLSGAWVDAARTELAEFDARLLEVMAEGALRRGSLDGVTAARTLVERHRYNERGYALLMRLQTRRGNVAEAITTFHRLRTLLLEELGTGPSAALVALHDRLLREGGLDAEAPTPRSAAIPLPAISVAAGAQLFVGRDAHLERLRRAWRESGAGQRRLAMLVGEAGVGKTQTAAQFAAEVHDAGATVLYGRCDEDPVRSYQPFVEALRHLVQHGGWAPDPSARGDLRNLARLIPEADPERDAADAPSDGEADRYRVFDAALGLLDRAAAARPVLLVLDDVQWADKPTVLLLRHLLRGASPARLLVLCSFRHTEVGDDDPLRELVAGTRRERCFDQIELHGLDERATDELIAAWLSAAATPAFVRGLQRRTDGNPLFIEESLRSLVEMQAIRAGEPASEDALDSIGVPDGVAEIILRRLARVSALTRDALVVGAVAGREFDMGPVQQVLETSGDPLIDAMEEAISVGLIFEVPGRVDRFAFCHALVREAVYGRLSTSRRLRLHLRTGRALEAGMCLEGPNPAEMAHHFFLARELGGAEQAVHYSMLAGADAAASSAYEDAVDHYRRALAALVPSAADSESRRCEILLALGRAQWQAGEAGARDTYLEVAASAHRRQAPEQLARAALGLGERYWEANMVDLEYQRLIAEALRELDLRDSTLRARLIARLGENLHFTAGKRHGAELCADALAMARRLGDSETILKALMACHVALLHTHHLHERRALIDEALTLTREHHGLAAEAHHWRTFDLCESGEIAAARREHANLAALAAQLGQPLLQYVAASWQGVFAYLDGDVEQAERLADLSLELGRRAQAGDALSSHAAKLLTLRRQQGRLAELLPAVRTVFSSTHLPAWEAALALAEIEVDDAERGRARYARLIADDLATVSRDWYWLPAVSLLAEAAWALDDQAGAALLYKALSPYADRNVQLSVMVNWGSLERHLGMLATTINRPNAAAEHFEAALKRNRESGALLMENETQCAYGHLLVRRDRPGDRARAAALGRAAEAVAGARGLKGLRRRAAALSHG